jgi:hypothetical protein
MCGRVGGGRAIIFFLKSVIPVAEETLIRNIGASESVPPLKQCDQRPKPSRRFTGGIDNGSVKKSLIQNVPLTSSDPTKHLNLIRMLQQNLFRPSIVTLQFLAPLLQCDRVNRVSRMSYMDNVDSGFTII